MLNENARKIVKEAEATGLSHAEIAQICGVTVGTVSRWKKLNRARANVIRNLEQHLEELKDPTPERKYLDEANLEDLIERARQLGFRVTITDTRI